MRGKQRSALVLVNEGLDAGSNLLATVYVARCSTSSEFGVFALAYAALPIGIVAARAVAASPILIRTPSGSRDRDTPDESAQRFAVTMAAAIGTLLMGAMLLVSFGIDTGPKGIVIALACAAPAVVVQDTHTYLLYHRKQHALAAVANATWTVCFAGGLAYLWVAGIEDPGFGLAFWAIAAYVSVVVIFVGSHLTPKLAGCWHWVQSQADLTKGLVIEETARQTSQQSVLYIVVNFATLSALAAFKVAQTVIGIPRLVINAYAPIILSQAATRIRNGEALSRYLAACSVANFTVMIVCALAIYMLPAEAGAWLFGDSWEGAPSAILGYGVAAALVGASMPFQAGLRAMESTSEAAAVRSAMAIITPTCVALGLLLDPTLDGALSGLVAASLVDLVVVLITYGRRGRAATRECR